MKEFVLSSQQPSRNFKIDYTNDLNKEQLKVVETGDGPTLVLAGAGSGKTRTITYRVAWLLEGGVLAQNILLLTFTNKAAKEMVERIEGLLGTFPQGLWSGTFHSIANRILRKYAPKLGYQSNFTILDQEDSKELIGLCVKELKIDTKGKRFPSSKVLQGILSYRSNKDVGVQSVLKKKHVNWEPLTGEIEAVSNLYKELKLKQNSMDFDDLLLKFLELLETHPDVQENLSNQFKYVLVDEFQDTNVIQARIVELLSRTHRNLLVVGDDAQSIYSFRAAEIKNILSFPKQYEGTGVHRLTKNYRSTPQILNLANNVIENNQDQFKKELTAINESGELPYLVPAASASQEAVYIADQILKLNVEGAPFNSMAVLFRAAYHSQSLEFELMKRDIPYEYRGGMKFFERAHVKDVVAHIRIFNNVKDAMAWVRALKIHPGIGVVTANKIARMCADLEDIEHVDSVTVSGVKAANGWEGFLRIANRMVSTDYNPSALIRAFAGSDEYRSYLENEYPNFHERLDDLEQFAIFAEQFDDMNQFLEAISLTDEYSTSKEKENLFDIDRLVLSTIHQSKGLEWGSVFVMHLAEGMFPGKRAYDEDSIEEERRLFYVAITRAKKNLFLTYPTTAGFDTIEMKQPSMFLEEIPSKCLEEVHLVQPNRLSTKFSSKSAFAYEDSGYEEPSIVLDDIGERVKKTPPSSFLGEY